MELFGPRSGFDIFNAHLRKAAALCRAEGLHPMIWSDRYSGMGSDTSDYYDRESTVPPDVAARISPVITSSCEPSSSISFIQKASPPHPAVDS